MLVNVLIGIIVAFAAYQAWAVQIERKRAIRAEQQLIAAVLAKNTGEFVASIDALQRTPADMLAQMKVENELAQVAYKLEESGGIPIT